VFGSEGTVAGMGWQTLAFVRWVFKYFNPIIAHLSCRLISFLGLRTTMLYYTTPPFLSGFLFTECQVSQGCF